MRTVRLAAVVALVSAALLCPVPVAGAQATYAISAGAELVRITVTPEAVDDPVDVGGNVTEARLDSAGLSTAHAASAFPGQMIIDRPTVLAALTGGLVDLPRYPLAARSTYPGEPSEQVGAGPPDLDASSGRFFSRGFVKDGVNQAEAEVLVNPLDDIVRGQARVSMADIEIQDPLLDMISASIVVVKGMRTITRVVRAPGEELHRTSSVAVAELIVAGRNVALPEGRLDALVGHPVVGELAKRGIEVTYIGAVETENGMTSAGLSVSWPAEIPGFGRARISVHLGRTFASITNEMTTGI